MFLLSQEMSEGGCRSGRRDAIADLRPAVTKGTVPEHVLHYEIQDVHNVRR